MGNPYNDQLEQGLGGGHVLNVGEGTVTTKFGGLLVITDTVIDAWDTNLANEGDLEGETISAGTYIAAKIDSILLTSGTAIAYERYN
jgi:hypothetical protein